MSTRAAEQDVFEAWRRHFGSVAPAGFECRVAHRERWVRIHSLPGGKRYPEDVHNRAEVLRRHLEVAEYALGTGDDLHLFVAVFGESPNPRPRRPFVPGRRRLSTIDALTGALPDATLWFWFAALRFARDELAEIVLARADEVMGPTLIANLTRGTAFAPYDGGADLFLTGAAEVVGAKNRWPTWISGRADGL